MATQNLPQLIEQSEPDNTQLNTRIAAIQAMTPLVANTHRGIKASIQTRKARAALNNIATNPDDYTQVRVAALTTLNNTTTAKVTTLLTHIANSTTSPDELRIHAAALLGTRTDRGSQAALIGLVGDSVPVGLATQALQSLDITRRNNRNIIIRTAQNSTSPDLQAAAITRIAEYPTRKSVRVLVALATTTDTARRATAINTLANTNKEPASEALGRIARDTNQPQDLRKQAITALGESHHHATATKTLPNIITNEIPLRTTAYQALIQHNTPSAKAQIQKLEKAIPDLAAHPTPNNTPNTKTQDPRDTTLIRIATSTTTNTPARTAAAEVLLQQNPDPKTLYYIAAAGPPDTQLQAIQALDNNKTQMATRALHQLVTDQTIPPNIRNSAVTAINKRDLSKQTKQETNEAIRGTQPDLPATQVTDIQERRQQKNPKPPSRGRL